MSRSDRPRRNTPQPIRLASSTKPPASPGLPTLPSAVQRGELSLDPEANINILGAYGARFASIDAELTIIVGLLNTSNKTGQANGAAIEELRSDLRQLTTEVQAIGRQNQEIRDLLALLVGAAGKTPNIEGKPPRGEDYHPKSNLPAPREQNGCSPSTPPEKPEDAEDEG